MNCLATLNQLAARMGASNPYPTQSSNRPCLAASLLRTGSQISISTATSLVDSVTVNATITHSTSPGALSISPPNSTNSSASPKEHHNDDNKLHPQPQFDYHSRNSTSLLRLQQHNRDGALMLTMTAVGPGKPLTAEKVERLAWETPIMDKPVKRANGFKNILSLDVIRPITARYISDVSAQLAVLKKIS